MISGLFIKQDKNGKYHIVSDETMQPVTVDMDYDEAVEFLSTMIENKARALKPNDPMLYYNRWETGFGKSK